MKSILFITSTNLATNPRLLKEMMTLKDSYQLTYLGMKLGGWSDDETERLQRDFEGHTFFHTDITRSNKKTWLFSTMIERLAQFVYRFFSDSTVFNAYASSKRSYLLWQKARSLKQYDLIVAHNLAALYPAYKLAARHKTKFAFDVEDYHPWESIYLDAKNEERRRNFLFTNILPKASFVTSASPLIAEEVKRLTGLEKIDVINNSFPQHEFTYVAPEQEKLKFIWYSQNISANRGLELVIPELYKFKDHVQIDLIGELNREFYENELKQFADFIHIHEPMSSNELNNTLCQYDVGLAIDVNSADRNREIALTNKIITYVQAGLFIFATDTKAHVKFLNDNEGVGWSTIQKSDAVSQLIEKVIAHRKAIRADKRKRFERGVKLSWENESGKLVNRIKENISE